MPLTLHQYIYVYVLVYVIITWFSIFPKFSMNYWYTFGISNYHTAMFGDQHCFKTVTEYTSLLCMILCQSGSVMHVDACRFFINPLKPNISIVRTSMKALYR